MAAILALKASSTANGRVMYHTQGGEMSREQHPPFVITNAPKPLASTSVMYVSSQEWPSFCKLPECAFFESFCCFLLFPHTKGKHTTVAMFHTDLYDLGQAIVLTRPSDRNESGQCCFPCSSITLRSPRNFWRV